VYREVFAIATDVPMGAEMRSAAETAGTDETEDSSVTRTRCSVSMVARLCASMPTLGSAITRGYSFLKKFILNNKYNFDAIMNDNVYVRLLSYTLLKCGTFILSKRRNKEKCLFKRR